MCLTATSFAQLLTDFGKDISTNLDVEWEVDAKWRELCRRENMDYAKVKKMAEENNIILDLKNPKEYDITYRFSFIGDKQFQLSTLEIYIKSKSIKLIKEISRDSKRREQELSIDNKIYLEKLDEIFLTPYPLKRAEWRISRHKPETIFVERINSSGEYSWAIRSIQSTDKFSYIQAFDIYLAIIMKSKSNWVSPLFE